MSAHRSSPITDRWRCGSRAGKYRKRALPVPTSRPGSDNGAEFVSLALDQWAYENGVTLDFFRLGKPTDNPSIESFNGSLREERLNTNWLISLEDAREEIETLRQDYNHFRLHSSLDNVSPVLFT